MECSKHRVVVDLLLKLKLLPSCLKDLYKVQADSSPSWSSVCAHRWGQETHPLLHHHVPSSLFSGEDTCSLGNWWQQSPPFKKVFNCNPSMFWLYMLWVPKYFTETALSAVVVEGNKGGPLPRSRGGHCASTEGSQSSDHTEGWVCCLYLCVFL